MLHHRVQISKDRLMNGLVSLG
ncbi:hypothetical protein V12B01_13305 [Vibrio splendidus 12B01]|nr:hypothetical protein V12B01_13305 [Vibrio splendidus 12B01]